MHRKEAGVVFSMKRTSVTSPWNVKRGAQLMFLASLLALSRPHAKAQSSQNQFWPQVNTYIKLDSRMRLMFMASRTKDGSTYNSAEFGPNLDITLKPIRRVRVQSNDSSKRTYLKFGVGYRYLKNLDKPNENRVLFELTPRYYLPLGILASDRNRFELRIISGDLTWRYRNRLTLERSFNIKSLRLTPYAQGEVYYFSQYGLWNKDSYAFGVVFPVHRQFEIKPYFQHDNDSRSSTPHVNALGLTLYLYF
jgi:hypothetical protein